MHRAFIMVVTGLMACSTASMQTTQSPYANHAQMPNTSGVNPGISGAYAASVSILAVAPPELIQLGIPLMAEGAGVVVGMDNGRLVILTATHVVGSKLGAKLFARVHVRDGGTQVLGVTVTFVSSKYDLSLVTTDRVGDPSTVIAGVAVVPPSIGDRLWVIGAPNGKEFNVTSGVLSSWEDCADDSGKCFRTDAAIYFGNSGGGVFSQRGELIGLVDFVESNATLDKGSAVNIVIPGSGGAISSETILDFFTEAHIANHKD